MKSKMHPWLILATVVCGLLLAPDLQSQPAGTNVEDTEQKAATLTNAPAPAEAQGTNAEQGEAPRVRRHRGSHNVIVSVGKPAELKAGDSAEAVVVIGSDAKVSGKVREAVVAIFGNVEVGGGEVGDAAVAILGNVRVSNGAKIRGEGVAVGGLVDVSADSTIEGETSSIDIGPFGRVNLARLKAWFIHCFLKLRPLALQVPWVWAVGGFIFLVYLLVGAVFPRPVLACVGELTRRPVTTLVLGGVSLIFLLMVFLILIATGVGLIVVPFLFAAVIFGFIIGKVATLEWLGLSIARQFGGEVLAKPVLGLVFGGLIIMVLYLVPVLGLVTFGVFGIWALGSAVTATFTGLRKEAPERPRPPAPVSAKPATPPASMPEPVPTAQATGPAPEAGPAAAPVSSLTLPFASPAEATQPGVPEVLAYPRAGFWERMGAGCLDFLLLLFIAMFFHRPLPAFLIGLAYFVGMWTWKGTTIGGIVLGLKVVRLDSQPLTLTTCLVRALAGVFAGMICFLGILWIAWDSEKQGWHDRIAGTVVLRLPRGTPLVCL